MGTKQLSDPGDRSDPPAYRSDRDRRDRKCSISAIAAIAAIIWKHWFSDPGDLNDRYVPQHTFREQRSIVLTVFNTCSNQDG